MLNCEMIARANTILETMYEEFRALPLPLFGGDMLRDQDPRGSRVAAATIRHRFLKSFSKPDPTTVKQLTKACYQGWIDFEDDLKGFSFQRADAKSKGIVYRARALLHSWLSDFDFNVSRMDPEFTPGETFTSQQGYVSIYQKLRRKDAWTVTHDAADDFIRLCYNNLSLKRCAKKHMVPLSREDSRRLFKAAQGRPHKGFAIFRARMYGEVLTLVHGSRASSVEKNATKRRFINVEPLGNVILQRGVAMCFREVLAQVGNDLETGQTVHRARIRGKVATVDFSNASDGTLLEAVRLMFPGSVTRTLCRYRSPMVLIEGVYHVPVKLSSMGCGFTFETMSLLLLAIARVLDPGATVYGDDVIVNNEVAHDFCAAAQAIGYKVNHEKTFIDAPFRESCGGFFMDGFGDICCYDIHYCESVMDVIIATNKFYRMWKVNPFHDCADLCRKAYEALLALVPPCYLGPVVDELLDTYAVCEDYRVRHMRDTAARSLWSTVMRRIGEILPGLSYNKQDVCFILVPRMVLKDASRRTRVLPDSTFRYASYLYAGKIAPDSIRGTEEEIFNLFAVLPGGLTIAVSALKTALSEEKDRLEVWLQSRSIFNSAPVSRDPHGGLPCTPTPETA